MAFTPTLPAATVYAVIDGGGNARAPSNAQALTYHTEVETYLGQLAPLVAAFDDAKNNVQLGVNVNPSRWFDAGAPLIQGGGLTLVGSDILTLANAKAQFSVIVGDQAARLANNLYCVNFLGLRTGELLTDGQYLDLFGTDAAYKCTFARNSVVLGNKGALNKTSLNSATIIGSGAAYCAGDVDGSIVIGLLAADANQSSVVQNFRNNITIGNFSSRFMTGEYNNILGNNAASGTGFSASFCAVFGRGALQGAGVNGTGLVAIGDSTLQSVGAGTNFAVGIGFGVDFNFSNSVGLGYQSGVSITGANQVQLGSTSHTVYAQAALSIRSDKRDKTDVAPIDTETSRKIVLGANWVSYRVDPRDAYSDLVETTREIEYQEEVIHDTGLLDKKGRPVTRTEMVTRTRTEPHHVQRTVERDGSRAGKRRHVGVLAQDEAKRLADLGIDFAGIKHAARDGEGSDVWSVQYEQYLPHIAAIITEQESRIAALSDENAMLRESLASIMTRLTALEAA